MVDLEVWRGVLGLVLDENLYMQIGQKHRQNLYVSHKAAFLICKRVHLPLGAWWMRLQITDALYEHGFVKPSPCSLVAAVATSCNVFILFCTYVLHVFVTYVFVKGGEGTTANNE